MKRIVIYILSINFLISCKESAQKQEKVAENTQKTTYELPEFTNAVAEKAIIYEANIRQYSKEGSFNAFTKDIPELKKLGVDILWLMPVYPISTTKSKGSLGSYYAVSDYKKVNPEFGTEEDLKELIRKAHEEGIYVILDWVANHTGWDHHWIKDHPEYYTKNIKGEIIHTEDTDWTDVADLNYDNKEMRQEMREAMKFWVKEFNIDGFRCDVAGMVPTDFWNKTSKELNDIKPVFLLAEGWKPELLDKAFDAGYSWDTHHVMNDIAKGEKTVEAWDERMKKMDSMYQKDDILMNFTTNHDENSWNGTVRERMGEAAELFAVLSYIAPGMPLIYSGQEYDMDKRLLFFEKDTIPKKKGKFFPLYEQLGVLKETNAALHSGQNAGSYKKLTSSDPESILAFERQKNGAKVLFIGNLSKKPVTFTLDHTGNYGDFFSKEAVELSGKNEYTYQPWQYKVLIVQN